MRGRSAVQIKKSTIVLQNELPEHELDEAELKTIARWKRRVGVHFAQANRLTNVAIRLQLILDVRWSDELPMPTLIAQRLKPTLERPKRWGMIPTMVRLRICWPSLNRLNVMMKPKMEARTSWSRWWM